MDYGVLLNKLDAKAAVIIGAPYLIIADRMKTFFWRVLDEAIADLLNEGGGGGGGVTSINTTAVGAVLVQGDEGVDVQTVDSVLTIKLRNSAIVAKPHAVAGEAYNGVVPSGSAVSMGVLA